MRWAIQTNLGSSRDAERLAQACLAQGQEVARLVRAPFDRGVPKLPTDMPTVFYGASSLIEAVAGSARWTPGAWPLDEDYSAWIERYGEHMLNAGARFMTLAQLAANETLAGDAQLCFARPCADTKLFAGHVAPAADLVVWARRALGVAEAQLDPATPLLLAEPIGISEEWRLFVVDGRVVTGSRYRSHARLDVRPEVPQEVREFAEARLREYTPTPVLVIDVGRSGERLYIIEFNGFNSSGFYAADLDLLVSAVSTSPSARGRAEPA